jgi:hypothetical protein
MSGEPNGQPELPELMIAGEVIAYLRLGAKGGNPAEQLRNLERRQGLPVLKRGRLRLYRRSEIDAWLAGAKLPRPARLPAAQGVTATNGAARRQRGAG